MTQFTRDPRDVPHSGDILEREGERRYVIAGGRAVRYTNADPDTVASPGKACFIAVWQRWASKADVIKMSRE